MNAFGESFGSPSSFYRLYPEVFSHPLWVDYQKASVPGSSDLLPVLMARAEELSTNGDINTTCQMLFLCAALSKHLKEYDSALQILEQINRLASQNNWNQVIQGATWGSAAVHFCQGQLQLATDKLNSLQILLTQAGDWVLADLVEVLVASITEIDTDKLQKDPLVDLLLSWGDTAYQAETPNPESKNGFTASQTRFKKIYTGLSAMFRETFYLFRKPRLLQTGSPGPIEPAHQQESNSIRSDTPAPILLETEQNLDHKEPSLVVYCLGQFLANQEEQPIEDWPTYKSKSVFKYMVTHRERPIAKEVLMELFWPDSPPNAARNNLNVAIYGIRRVLHQKCPDFSHILFQEGQYSFNPRMRIWVDAEEFSNQINYAKELNTMADPAMILREYQKAETLYQGDFLDEDRYEEWTIMPRENLRLAYLDCLSQLSHIYFQQEQYMAAAALCQRSLAYDDCSEDAYRLLMRCYVRQGQPNLALRLYHSCLSTLKKELDIPPSSETLALYERIRNYEPV